MSTTTEKKRKVFEELCLEFLQQNCEHDLTKILAAGSNDQCHAILVSYMTVFEICPSLGDAILNQPGIALRCCDDAAKRALVLQYEKLTADIASRKKYTLKKNVRVRVHSLPEQPQLIRLEFPGTKDIGSFVCILGTVVRTSTPKLLEYAKLYRCSRCKQMFEFEAKLENSHSFPRKLTKCALNLCINATVTPVEDTVQPGEGKSTTKYRDYQEIKLQEQVHRLECGSMPKSLSVILEDDLLDSCKPGDDVAICGEVVLRWKPFRQDRAADTELCFKANYVQVNNNQRTSMLINEEMEQFVRSFWKKYSSNPLDGRNHILASFCPQIYGMYVTKLALCVVICGGVGKERSGNRIRGESHLLMVGDPGTGKSQLMKYVSNVCPRSIMTNGIGTTSAGLTVSAVKDCGEWQLEAGALVLADGGVCCIDEFSCMKEHDRTSIHEAMEQQTISVAKAGMVCKLTTRCTIIASTNPKGKYDPNESLPVNIALPGPLLSRFDVLLVLRDAQNERWDSLVADFILQGQDPHNKPVNTKLLDLWDVEKLQSYLVMAKEQMPQLTDRANEVLSAYYQFQRRSENRNSARTTVRLLESLIRLAEGHARLMFRQEVLLIDSIMAISLIESSMQGFSMLSESNILHTSFPEDSMEDYKTQAHVILSKLDLADLWAEEMDNIERAGRKYGNLMQEDNRICPSPKTNIEVLNQPILSPPTKKTKVARPHERERSQRQSLSPNENVEPVPASQSATEDPKFLQNSVNADASYDMIDEPSLSPTPADDSTIDKAIDKFVDELPDDDFFQSLRQDSHFVPVSHGQEERRLYPASQALSVDVDFTSGSIQRKTPHQPPSSQTKPSSSLAEFRKRLERFKTSENSV